MDDGARDGRRVHDVIGTILSVATQWRTMNVSMKMWEVLEESLPAIGRECKAQSSGKELDCRSRVPTKRICLEDVNQRDEEGLEKDLLMTDDSGIIWNWNKRAVQRIQTICTICPFP